MQLAQDIQWVNPDLKNTVMKAIFCIMATLALSGWGQAAPPAGDHHQLDQERSKTGTVTCINIIPLQVQSIHPRNLFTLSDAESILGEKAHLSDSASAIEGDVATYKCAYTANSKDPKTGKTGVIYVMFEEYAQVSSAKKAYSSIKTSNENHEGVKVLPDMADEAYFHSDGKNFYFILARKGVKMLRMKVNKTTATTSLNQFNLIARKVTAAL